VRESFARTLRRVGPLACASLTFPLLLATACHDPPAERGSADTPAPARRSGVDVPRYFPLSPGDRWRTRGGSDGTVPRAFGVTGVDARGVAVIFGGAGETPERYRADAQSVTRVDEQGRPLFPVLRAPLEEGATWSYALTERGVSIPCSATLTRVDPVARTVAGASFTACVTVHRACRYPAGAPFPLATTHERDETYCPDIGLVEETQRFTPPPAPGLLPATLRERLVAWRVRGAPPPVRSAALDCDDVVLLPSDVQAACGTALVPRGERTGAAEDGACVFRYAGGGRDVEVRVRDARDGRHASVGAATGGGAHLRFETARASVYVSGCDDPRLVALLRTLVP
jgi:hypothetical protein